MAEPLFIEQLSLMVPTGFQDAVREAAHQQGQTASEFIRSAIRDRLRSVAAEQPSAGD